MILVFLLYLRGIFAKNRFYEISNERMGNEFLKKIGEENYFGQPRFNASCDKESLEAATECEERNLD